AMPSLTVIECRAGEDLAPAGQRLIYVEPELGPVSDSKIREAIQDIENLLKGGALIIPDTAITVFPESPYKHYEVGRDTIVADVDSKDEQHLWASIIPIVHEFGHAVFYVNITHKDTSEFVKKFFEDVIAKEKFDIRYKWPELSG